MPDAAAGTEWLFERLAAYGEKTFLVLGDESYTYGVLAAETEAASARLREEGVAHGETVALMGDFGLRSIAWFLALVRNRNIAVPIVSAIEQEQDSRLREAGVQRVVRDFDRDRPAVSTVPAPAEPHALIARLRSDGSSGLILFSSGLTGRPKAMVHNFDRLLDGYRDRKGRSLTVLLFLMFDHIGGINTLFNGIAMGGTLVFSENKDPDLIASIIERHQVNLLPTSPTFLNMFLLSGVHERFNLSSLRMITYGTEPMSDSLLARLRTAFPKVRFMQTFGTSETGIAQTVSLSSDSTFFKITDPDVEYKVVEGELHLRGRTNILGYLNHPMTRFTPDGWFKTGDLVEEGADGYFRIVGRREEVINVGGQKVLPSEVETSILLLDFVRDCLVRGEPNPLVGQIVVAEVAVKEGVPDSEAVKIIRAHCLEHLERYKVPRKIRIVDSVKFTERFKKDRGLVSK